MALAAFHRNAKRKLRVLTPEQSRAARGLLNWTQDDLAERASISRVSISLFEAGGVMRDTNQRRLRLTFEAAGVQFIAENGGGAGVRLAKPKGTK